MCAKKGSDMDDRQRDMQIKSQNTYIGYAKTLMTRYK